MRERERKERDLSPSLLYGLISFLPLCSSFSSLTLSFPAFCSSLSYPSFLLYFALRSHLLLFPLLHSSPFLFPLIFFSFLPSSSFLFVVISFLLFAPVSSSSLLFALPSHLLPFSSLHSQLISSPSLSPPFLFFVLIFFSFLPVSSLSSPFPLFATISFLSLFLSSLSSPSFFLLFPLRSFLSARQIIFVPSFPILSPFYHFSICFFLPFILANSYLTLFPDNFSLTLFSYSFSTFPLLHSFFNFCLQLLSLPIFSLYLSLHSRKRWCILIFLT